MNKFRLITTITILILTKVLVITKINYFKIMLAVIPTQITLKAII